MTELPKIVPTIVYDRLRAAATKSALPAQTAPERAHPDADVLTAFAEQALSAAERDGVLEHLARCGDCRELIALALPPADLVAAPIAAPAEAGRATVSRAGAPAPRKLNFAWPTLRWAALAAGVAVAAAVLLVHPGKLNQGALPSENRQVNGGPQASGPQIAASPAASSSVAAPSTDQLAVLAKTEEPQPKPELRSSQKSKARQTVMPPHQTEHGILLADNKKDLGQADKLPAAPSAGARAFNYDAPASRGATETVEVSGATGGLETESSSLKVMAHNNVPAIEKAKPAPQGIERNGLQKAEAPVVPGPPRLQARNVMSAAKLTSSASPALAHNVTWAITAGVLQRSLDSGRSWQDALRADRPFQCYASYGEELWTGGQAGELFHSADSGVTWLQVQPSIKALPLTSDITHIDLPGPAEVVISTSNHEIWSSADSGKTWGKK
jgi:Putative zinc-finger